MSRQAASRIANYLTGGFHDDFGYRSLPFDKEPGDTLSVFIDFSRGADRRIVDAALDSWSSVTGLNFRLNGTARNHDLRLTDSDFGAYSYSQQAGPGGRPTAVVNVGRDWLNAYGTDTVSYYTQTWIHEIGHALGLGHTGPYNGSASWGDQKFALDSWQMSIMSYFAPYENPNVDASYAYVLTPMPADIIAIHRLYGQPDDISSGADIYGFDGTAAGIYKLFGNMLDRAKLDQPVMLTIYDSGGRDTLNMSGYRGDQRIDLHQGAFSDVLGSIGTLGIAYGTKIEGARSGKGDDEIDGNAGRNWLYSEDGHDDLAGYRGADRLFSGAGNDRLIGGSGNDIMKAGAGADFLRGGKGDDVMFGGAGADRFVFRGPDANAHDWIDTIRDFDPDADILDLRGLGLDRLRDGAGVLREGLVRTVDRDGDLHILADLDNDRRADLHVILQDCDAITTANLML